MQSNKDPNLNFHLSALEHIGLVDRLCVNVSSLGSVHNSDRVNTTGLEIRPSRHHQRMTRCIGADVIIYYAYGEI